MVCIPLPVGNNFCFKSFTLCLLTAVAYRPQKLSVGMKLTAGPATLKGCMACQPPCALSVTHIIPLTTILGILFIWMGSAECNVWCQGSSWDSERYTGFTCLLFSFKERPEIGDWLSTWKSGIASFTWKGSRWSLHTILQAVQPGDRMLFYIFPFCHHSRDSSGSPWAKNIFIIFFHLPACPFRKVVIAVLAPLQQGAPNPS